VLAASIIRAIGLASTSETSVNYQTSTQMIAIFDVAVVLLHEFVILS
jgi:hypothetical protein